MPFEHLRLVTLYKCWIRVPLRGDDFPVHLSLEMSTYHRPGRLAAVPF
jgi:hypothetical protein